MQCAFGLALRSKTNTAGSQHSGELVDVAAHALFVCSDTLHTAFCFRVAAQGSPRDPGHPTRADRDADVGLRQRGRVVDAVADHGDRRAAPLQRPHRIRLPPRQHLQTALLQSYG